MLSEKLTRFVLNGMLEQDKDSLLKRLAVILSNTNTSEMIVDGVPSNPHLVDLDTFKKAVSKHNVAAVDNAHLYLCYHNGDRTIRVHYTHLVKRWRKPGSNDSYGRYSQIDGYTEEFEYKTTDSVEFPVCQAKEYGFEVDYI